MRTWPALEVARLDASSPPGATPEKTELGDLVQAALIEHDVTAIEDTSLGWRVFFQTPSSRDLAAIALREQFPSLSISHAEMPDDDWAARSQADLRAVQVGNIVVAPPWDVLRAPIVIVIQPSMGFGTGHHATTRLCLSALQQLNLRGRTVIDVGTGSGVLAIAASRLGADTVLALDDDADAIQAARENLTLNRTANVTLRVADFRVASAAGFDLVIANLTGALLIAACERFAALTAPRAHMILSGFTAGEEEAVRGSFARFTVDQRSAEDEWLCVTLSRSAL